VVIGGGIWYSTLPFFGAILVLGLIARDMVIPKFVERYFGALLCGAIVLFAAGALAQHMTHPYLKRDWTLPYQRAAQHLGVIAGWGEHGAETSDGIVSFYSPIPVFSLTGLGNNQEFYNAVIDDSLEHYFQTYNIQYIVSEVGVGPHAPSHHGYQGREVTNGKSCEDPFYDERKIKIFAVENCL